MQLSAARQIYARIARNVEPSAEQDVAYGSVPSSGSEWPTAYRGGVVDGRTYACALSLLDSRLNAFGSAADLRMKNFCVRRGLGPLDILLGGGPATSLRWRGAQMQRNRAVSPKMANPSPAMTEH